MDRKTNRLLLLICACSVTGAVVGGTSNWVDSRLCLQAKTPTLDCLSQNPMIKTIQGMSVGLVAGAGAALGAVYQLKRQGN